MFSECSQYSFNTLNRASARWVFVNRICLFACFCLVLSSLVGCKPEPDTGTQAVEEEVAIPDPLTVLVIGDAPLGQRISRQWSARRDGELTIVDQSISEFASGDYEIGEDVDVILYPPAMMGELVGRDRLQMLRKELLNSDQFNRVELLRHFRISVIRHRSDSWAVPLGGPNFTLLCNRPLFEAKKLNPPATWEELDRILVKIDKWNKAGETKLAARVDVPLASGWAAQSFLARVAPAICSRGKISSVFDRRTMNPLIAEPVFVEALAHLMSISSAKSLELDPGGVFELANSGHSAFAMSWPSRGFAMASDETPIPEAVEGESESVSDERLMIGSVPGTMEWFDLQSGSWVKRGPEGEFQAELIGFSGLVASVTSGSPNDRTAWDFLEWLPSKKISLLTLVESPRLGPFRASHLGDASRWTGDAISVDVADEFADAVAANHDRSLTLMFPRIPGYDRYLVVLDNAVRAAVSGEQSPEEALQSAAKKWDEITDSIGRQAQIRDLRKESGL